VELVTQTMRRYPELTLRNTGLLHDVVETLERLFQRQAWMSQMRGRVQSELQGEVERRALVIVTDGHKAQAATFGFLFQGEVHALVTTVLLRMAGLDALDGDAQAQPPDGQLGEVEQGVGAGEGDAVVGADGGREAALEEELLEGGDGGVFAG
jgi:hypothetical protein